MKPDMKQKAAEMIGKRFDYEIATKAVSINEEKHTAIFVMSTEAVDRHGEVVDQSSWVLEHFEKCQTTSGTDPLSTRRTDPFH